jgi:hypothetical protein
MHIDRRDWACLKLGSEDPDGSNLPLLHAFIMMVQKSLIKSSTNILGNLMLFCVAGSSQTLSINEAMDEGSAGTLHNSGSTFSPFSAIVESMSRHRVTT